MTMFPHQNYYDDFPFERIRTIFYTVSYTHLYLRYMDPHNAQALVSEKADHYWQNVDLYVGGTEHATGPVSYTHLTLV